MEQIALFIEQDNFSVTDICRMYNISRKTFYDWKETKPQFAQAIDEATEIRDEKLLSLARKGLAERLRGYTVYEEKVTSVPDRNQPSGFRIIKKETKKKEYGPDLKAIKLMLERNDKKEAEEREKAKEKDKPENRPWNITVVDEKTKHELMFLRDKMKDGTHPQITGIRRDPDWEKEYIEADTAPSIPQGGLNSKATKSEEVNSEAEPAQSPKKNVFVSAARGVPPGYTHRK